MPANGLRLQCSSQLQVIAVRTPAHNTARWITTRSTPLDSTSVRRVFALRGCGRRVLWSVRRIGAGSWPTLPAETDAGAERARTETFDIKKRGLTMADMNTWVDDDGMVFIRSVLVRRMHGSAPTIESKVTDPATRTLPSARRTTGRPRRPTGDFIFQGLGGCDIALTSRRPAGTAAGESSVVMTPCARIIPAMSIASGDGDPRPLDDLVALCRRHPLDTRGTWSTYNDARRPRRSRVE